MRDHLRSSMNEEELKERLKIEELTEIKAIIASYMQSMDDKKRNYKKNS